MTNEDDPEYLRIPYDSNITVRDGWDKEKEENWKAADGAIWQGRLNHQKGRMRNPLFL